MAHSNPPYFDNTEPHHWTLLSYLNTCFPCQTSFSTKEYHKQFNRWYPSIVDLSHSAEPKKASAAQLLIARFPKDKIAARNWFSNRKGTGKQYRSKGGSSRVTIKRTIEKPGAVNIVQESSSESAQPATVIHGPVNAVNSGVFLNPIIDQRSESSIPPTSHHHQDATGSQDHSPYPLPSTVINGSVQAVNSGTFVNPILDQRSSQNSDSPLSSPPSADDDPESSFEPASSEPPEEETSSFQFFSTGRVLEDIVRDSNLPTSHIAHQGIIDLGDKQVIRLFETFELGEMTACIPSKPETDPLFMSSMARFAHAKTFADFRNIAENVPYREGEYDHSKHAQAAWVNQVILWMLPLLHSFGDLRSRELTEGWFDSSLWSILTDCCSFSFPWMTLRRKELPSWSLKSLASVTETQTDKSNQSSHFDGIIHDHSDPHHHEFAMYEVAKDFTTTQSAKWVSDERKAIIGMHGMTRTISASVNHDETTLKSVQVIGIVHARFSFMVLIGTPLSQRVTLISRGGLRTVPSTIETLRNIFPVLKSLHLAMKTMDRCRTALAKFRDGGNASGSDDGFTENLEKSGF